jgi:hypothetical protein
MSYLRWLRDKLGKRKIILASAAVVLRDQRVFELCLRNGCASTLALAPLVA